MENSITKTIEEIMNEVYDDWNFLPNIKEYMNKSLVILKKNIKKRNQKITKNHLKEELNEILKELINSDMCKNGNIKIFIDNFINERILAENNLETNISEFQKLDIFTKEINTTIPIETITQIIENKKIRRLLEEITRRNNQQLKRSISNCSLLSKLLEAYYIENTIEAVEENNTINTNSLIKKYYGISKFRLLTNEEALTLIKRTKKGDIAAKNELIEKNMCLVISIAKKFLKNRNKIELFDLTQEGCIGLMLAIDYYDINKDIKFSTYAYWWIKKMIVNAIFEKEVRIPDYLQRQMSKYYKAKEKLLTELNRTPTEEEIAQETEISIDKITKINHQFDNMASLNTIIDDNNKELCDLLPVDIKELDEEYIKEELKNKVEELLQSAKLTEKEIDIIKLRYGFYNDEPYSLKSIGMKYNLSPGRIHKIEQDALSKLRNSKIIKEFLIYIQYPDIAIKKIEELKQKEIEEKKKFSEYMKLKYQNKKNLTKKNN